MAFKWSIIALAIFAAAICGGGSARAFAPENGDFSKTDPTAVRVLDWNTEKRFISLSAADGNFQRVLKAINPDVIVFEEINADSSGGAQPSAADIKARLESILGGTWTVNRGNTDGFNRNALCTRFGLSMQAVDTVPSSEVRGVVMGLVDIPGPVDLYVMGAHFKSGDPAAVDSGTDNNETRRQHHADAIVNWERDARTAGGSINLPAGTPMIFCGDTNLDFGSLAPNHPYTTLLTGDIVGNAKYGADSAPDWDGTANSDPWPYDRATGDSDTHSSNTGSPTSRYDRFVYTDSVCHAADKFILNTQNMASAALAAAGLQANDTNGALNAPDHLPVVVDFLPGADPEAGKTGRLIMNEFNYDNPGTDTVSFLECKNIGDGALNLSGPAAYFLVRSDAITETVPTAENEASRIRLEGVVPPGGLFVLYNASADSSGIASAIQAALPGPQRQNTSAFYLTNGPNRAIALVTSVPTGLSTVSDTADEGFLYASTLGSANHFLRTASDNNLTITLGPAQTSGLSLISSTQSYSRLLHDKTLNNFSSWIIPDAMTPARPNSSGPNAADDWALYP